MQDISILPFYFAHLPDKLIKCTIMIIKPEKIIKYGNFLGIRSDKMILNQISGRRWMSRIAISKRIPGRNIIIIKKRYIIFDIAVRLYI